MEKEIKIKIISKQFELSRTLMDKLFEAMDYDESEEDYEAIAQEGEAAAREENDDVLELTTDGYLSENENRVEITYAESELTGMEGATTTISFDKNEPKLITMLRGGSVTTAMVFESGMRHICVYETPVMPFELCIHTLKVKNELLENGKIYLDYIVEFKGAQAERTKFTLMIEEKFPSVLPLDEYNEV